MSMKVNAEAERRLNCDDESHRVSVADDLGPRRLSSETDTTVYIRGEGKVLEEIEEKSNVKHFRKRSFNVNSLAELKQKVITELNEFGCDYAFELEPEHICVYGVDPTTNKTIEIEEKPDDFQIGGEYVALEKFYTLPVTLEQLVYPSKYAHLPVLPINPELRSDLSQGVPAVCAAMFRSEQKLPAVELSLHDETQRFLVHGISLRQNDVPLAKDKIQDPYRVPVLVDEEKQRWLAQEFCELVAATPRPDNWKKNLPDSYGILVSPVTHEVKHGSLVAKPMAKTQTGRKRKIQRRFSTVWELRKGLNLKEYRYAALRDRDDHWCLARDGEAVKW